MPDLTELIRGLSPGALAIFKRQLASLPQVERERAFSRLSGIPELAEIVGRTTPMALLEAPREPQAAQPKATDIPLWQRGLQTATAPLNWISRNITEPFGTLVTMPFTPAVAGTEGMNWWERERAEYKAWDDPSLGVPFTNWQVGVKGVLETLPWLAVPSAAGISARLGAVAKGGGELARGAALAQKVVKPIAAVEAVPGKIVGKVAEKVGLKKIVPVVPKAAVVYRKTLYRGIGQKPVDEGVYGKGTYFSDRPAIAKGYGKVTESEVTLHKPFVADFPEQIEELGREARKAAIAAGKSVKEQNELASQAIRKTLERQGYDGVVLKIYRGEKVVGEEVIVFHPDKAVKAVAPEVAVKPSVAGVPPIKPPVPPTAVGAGALPEYPEFNRFWQAISGKAGKEAEVAKQTLLTSARAKLAARVTARLSKIDPSKLTEAEFNRIWQEESSPLLGKLTKLGFPEEFQDEGVRRIREVLLAQKASEFEVKSTITAFINALNGKGVPRKVGIKGGSAYTRLERVFGKEATDILASPSKLEKMAGPQAVKRPEWLDKPEPLFRPEGLVKPAPLLRPEALEKPVPLLKPEPPWTPLAVKEVSKEATEQLRIELAKAPAALSKDSLDYLRALPPDEQAKQLAMFPQAKREVISDTLDLAGRNLLDAANIPRATMSSLDWSGVGRQGAIASFRHPVAALKQIYPMVKATFDPKYAERINSEILTHPSVQKFLKPSLKDQLYLAPLPEKITGLLVKEEAYATNLAMRLPIIGPIIRGSARSFVTFLNLMRAHMAIDMDAKWLQKVGQKGFQVTDLDYSEMAKLINWSTGRGDIPFGLNKYAVIANATLFSPKLFFSRFEWPTMILSPSREVRIEAWKQIGSFLGAVSSILLAAKTAGVGKIELDPRSSDFGKLRYKDTRLDIWTGYAQYIKFISQLATGRRKTAGGYLQSMTRGEVISRFMQSKLSPAAGLLNDILKGQTYLGEEFPAKSAKGILGQVYNRTFPLAMQDMVDGFIQSGTLGGIVSSVGVLGVGVVTYMDEAKQERDKAAQKEYRMTWEEVGRQYGRAAQLRLEQTTPAILKAEQEMEERYATGSPTLMRQWHAEGQSYEDTYRDLVNKAAAEVRLTHDWAQFREKVDKASDYRRESYNTRQKRKEYQDIVAYYNQPLKPEQVAQMNPGDVLRREYYQIMFAPDMYDQFGNYLFDEAEKREQDFVKRYGQQALDYIEEYRGARWVEKPTELKALEEARDLLRPYWGIVDNVWSMYSPELKTLSDQIQLMENTDPVMAKQMLRRYPAILRARELIARYKAQMRQYNPAIQQAFRIFYGY